MSRWIVLLFAALLVASPVLAQNTPPDYAIRNIRSRFLTTNDQMQVQFEVWNVDGAATVTSTAALTVIGTGQQVATDVVPALKAQEIVTVTLTFPVSMFPPDTVQSFRATVGIGEVEAAGSANVQSNSAQITITFPALSPESTETPGASSNPSNGPKDILTEFLETLGIKVNLSDPTVRPVIAVIVGAIIILLLIIVIIIRALFQRPPDFGNWQPPYANMPFLDPNSQAGRRQQWQLHAQNASLPGGCVDGNVQARKLTMGRDGQYFSGWRITAMRISHYDQYGRVNRSQVIASKGVVNRLNSVIRRRGKLTPEKMMRQLRPAANGLANPLKKKLNERNVMLPFALDIRLEGKHEDTRILFELYQCQRGQWKRIDQWEPEMAVIGKMIHESGTYTLYGMRPGETLKLFRQRLADDLTQTLYEIVMPPVGEQKRENEPTNPHMEQVNIG